MWTRWSTTSWNYMKMLNSGLAVLHLVSDMRVRIKSFGPLYRALGERVLELSVPEGATVRRVMEHLAESRGVGHLVFEGDGLSGNFIIMLNRRDVDTLQGEDTPVHDGDVITVLPHVQGG